MGRRGGVFTWDTVRVVVEAPAPLLSRTACLLGVAWAPTPAGTAAAPDIRVARAGREWVLRSAVEESAAGCRDDAVMKLVALVSYQFLVSTAHTVLHGGAFLCADRAVTFVGPPLVGKSTLAHAAWRRGYSVVGDDWLVLHGDGTVSPFPKPLKTRVGDRAAALATVVGGSRHDSLVGRLGSEHRLALGRALPRMVPLCLRVPVAALFLIERGTARATRIDAAPRDAALAALLTQTMPTRGRKLGGVRMLEAVRRAGRVYRLTVGENEVEQAITLMAAVVTNDAALHGDLSGGVAAPGFGVE